MRRSIRVERRLDAPPEMVFETLADHARYDRFEGIRRAELVKPGDPAPNGLGAVRWVWVGPLRFEEEITAFESPRRFDYLIRHVRPLPFRHEGASVRLEPDGTGTNAVWTSSSSEERWTRSSSVSSSAASLTCSSEAVAGERLPRGGRTANLAHGPLALYPSPRPTKVLSWPALLLERWPDCRLDRIERRPSSAGGA
jgi:uncharacterized protein YndB with AHSA1/START domain